MSKKFNRTVKIEHLAKTTKGYYDHETVNKIIGDNIYKIKKHRIYRKDIIVARQFKKIVKVFFEVLIDELLDNFNNKFLLRYKRGMISNIIRVDINKENKHFFNIIF